MHLVDKRVGHATEAEAPAEEGAVRFHVRERRGGGGDDFIDGMAGDGGGEGPGKENVLWSGVSLSI